MSAPISIQQSRQTNQHQHVEEQSNISNTLSWMGRKVVNIACSTVGVIGKIAIPAILMVAMSSVPGAEAGPLTYTACVSACSASVFLAPACPFLCAPALGPYCP
ncbi:MAG: hypothetical protein P4L16_04920 [Chlamydiales bacterium]|nr:hypothetical protein [Chlamydiales bacterium]